MKRNKVNKHDLVQEGEEISEQDFKGNYLQKKMKNHNLPYGMDYLNLLAKHEAKADKLWEKEMKKIINPHLLNTTT